MTQVAKFDPTWTQPVWGETEQYGLGATIFAATAEIIVAYIAMITYRNGRMVEALGGHTAGYAVVFTLLVSIGVAGFVILAVLLGMLICWKKCQIQWRLIKIARTQFPLSDPKNIRAALDALERGHLGITVLDSDGPPSVQFTSPVLGRDDSGHEFIGKGPNMLITGIGVKDAVWARGLKQWLHELLNLASWYGTP